MIAPPPARGLAAESIPSAPTPLGLDDYTTEEVPADGTLDPAPVRRMLPGEVRADDVPTQAPALAVADELPIVTPPRSAPTALLGAVLATIVALAAIAAALVASAAVISTL